MLKPLTEEQIQGILEKATDAFARHGYARANISSIAREAGVSVGVLYKYYTDKKGLFTACVRRSLDYLDEVFRETEKTEGSLPELVDTLIRRNQEAAREHPEFFRLYHQITASGGPEEIRDIAEVIEGAAARIYRDVLAEAQEKGEVRQDLDPELFAFFFDDLMMMLHFSYTCSYYKDRFRIYLGEDWDKQDERVRKALLSFLGGAMKWDEGRGK